MSVFPTCARTDSYEWKIRAGSDGVYLPPELQEIPDSVILFSFSVNDPRAGLLPFRSKPQCGAYFDTLHPVPPLQSLIMWKFSHPGHDTHVLSRARATCSPVWFSGLYWEYEFRDKLARAFWFFHKLWSLHNYSARWFSLNRAQVHTKVSTIWNSLLLVKNPDSLIWITQIIS